MPISFTDLGVPATSSPCSPSRDHRPSTYKRRFPTCRGRDVCGQHPPARARPSRSAAARRRWGARKGSAPRPTTSPRREPPARSTGSLAASRPPALSVTSVYGGVGRPARSEPRCRVLVACPAASPICSGRVRCLHDAAWVVVTDEADHGRHGFRPGGGVCSTRRLSCQTPRVLPRRRCVKVPTHYQQNGPSRGRRRRARRAGALMCFWRRRPRARRRSSPSRACGFARPSCSATPRRRPLTTQLERGSGAPLPPWPFAEPADRRAPASRRRDRALIEPTLPRARRQLVRVLHYDTPRRQGLSAPGPARAEPGLVVSLSATATLGRRAVRRSRSRRR